jgi:ribonuclease P protein component
MISSAYRFHGHGSLRFVYRNGQSIRTRLFTIKYTKNQRRKRPRFSVVVSKKVFKGSVGRNRIRRRIYEQLRLQIPNIKEAYDIVVIVSSSEIISMPAAELHEQLITNLKEAGIIHN